MDKLSFFNALKKPPVKVMTIEGIDIYCKQMTVGERDIFETKIAGENPESIRAMYILLSACDVDGKPLFEESDLPSITNMPIAVGYKLFNKIAEVNPIQNKDIEELKKS